MIEWKKMSEEQPTKDGEYLVHFEGLIGIAPWQKGFPWDNDITHWAEINKPEDTE